MPIPRSRPLLRWSTQGSLLLKALAGLALAAGVGGGAALVFAPATPPAPPLLLPAPPAPTGTQDVLAWFGGEPARPDIRIIGLISSGADGVALLALGQDRPRAFRVGQDIAQGLRLEAVHAAAISIVQDGQVQEIAVARTHADDPRPPAGPAHPPAPGTARN